MRFSTSASKGAKEIRPVGSDPLASSRGMSDENNGRTKKVRPKPGKVKGGPIRRDYEMALGRDWGARCNGLQM